MLEPPPDGSRATANVVCWAGDQVVRELSNAPIYELGKVSGFGGLDVAAAQELLAALDAATNLTELGNMRAWDCTS